MIRARQEVNVPTQPRPRLVLPTSLACLDLLTAPSVLLVRWSMVDRQDVTSVLPGITEEAQITLVRLVLRVAYFFFFKFSGNYMILLLC